VLPLHPNHRLLYETILQLAPASVIEFGCGGGDHLNNLHVLAPGLSLNGCDISGDQLELLRTRHPGLSANIFAQNITEPFGEGGPRYDVAYSQAVIMHIQTGRKHLDALENMFRAARNQVVFQENWLKHDFMGDILELRSRNRIAWEGLHFHYRISPEYGRPHQMVVSATELPAYPKLDRYDRLLEGLK
jgi:SAM-dependent methyltransferase